MESSYEFELPGGRRHILEASIDVAWHRVKLRCFPGTQNEDLDCFLDALGLQFAAQLILEDHAFGAPFIAKILQGISKKCRGLKELYVLALDPVDRPVEVDPAGFGSLERFISEVNPGRSSWKWMVHHARRTLRSYSGPLSGIHQTDFPNLIHLDIDNCDLPHFVENFWSLKKLCISFLDEFVGCTDYPLMPVENLCLTVSPDVVFSVSSFGELFKLMKRVTIRCHGTQYLTILTSTSSVTDLVVIQTCGLVETMIDCLNFPNVRRFKLIHPHNNVFMPLSDCSLMLENRPGDVHYTLTRDSEQCTLFVDKDRKL